MMARISTASVSAKPDLVGIQISMRPGDDVSALSRGSQSHRTPTQVLRTLHSKLLMGSDLEIW